MGMSVGGPKGFSRVRALSRRIPEGNSGYDWLREFCWELSV